MHDEKRAEEKETEAGAEGAPEQPEAAPTDYRGNVVILVVMLCVVLLAWVISLVTGDGL